jgi:hypothetical protein
MPHLVDKYRRRCFVIEVFDELPHCGRLPHMVGIKIVDFTFQVSIECSGPQKLDHLIVCNSGPVGPGIRSPSDEQEATQFFTGV